MATVGAQRGGIDHDGQMGSSGSTPRKRRRRLPKVPKYEEPNQLEGAGSGDGFGRSGHSTDRRRSRTPGRAGSYLLRLLGQRPKQ